MISTNDLALVLTSKSKYEAAFNCGDLNFVLLPNVEVTYFDDSSELPDRINRERMKNADLWIIFGKDDTNDHPSTSDIINNLILSLTNQDKLSVKTLRFHFMYGCGCVTTSFILKKLFQEVNLFSWIKCTSIFFWNINLSEISNPSNRWLNMVLADETSSLTFEQCTIDGLRITASELGSGTLSLKEISIIGPFSIKSGIIVLNSNLSKPTKKDPVIKVLNANRVFEEYSCNFIPETSSTMRIELNTELFPSPWPQPPVPQSKPQLSRVQQLASQSRAQQLASQSRAQQLASQSRAQQLASQSRVQQPVSQSQPQVTDEKYIENVLSLILTDKWGNVSSYKHPLHHSKAKICYFGKSSNLPNEINEVTDKTELEIVFSTDTLKILDNFHTKFMNLSKHLKVLKLSLDFSMCDEVVTSSVIQHDLFSKKFLFSKITYSYIVWKGVRLDISPVLDVVVNDDTIIDFKNCKIGGEIWLSVKKQRNGQEEFPQIRIQISPSSYLEKHIHLVSDKPNFPLDNIFVISRNAQGLYELPSRKIRGKPKTILDIVFNGSANLGNFQEQYDCCVPMI
jgi:hypothetical protein